MLGLPAPFGPHSASLGPDTATRVLCTPVPVSAPPTGLDECLFFISLVSDPLAVRFSVSSGCARRRSVSTYAAILVLRTTDVFPTAFKPTQVLPIKKRRHRPSALPGPALEELCVSAASFPHSRPLPRLPQTGFAPVMQLILALATAGRGPPLLPLPPLFDTRGCLFSMAFQQ